jgi:hypothetical protein
MATYGAQHLRAETLLILTKQSEDAGHAANAVGGLNEQLGCGAGAEGVQVFGTALEAKAVERIETDHRRVLRIGAVHAGGYDVVSREEHIQAIT